MKMPSVCDVHRFVQRRPAIERGETEKPLSVLLSFHAESLAFIPNPLLCFRCQAYGHVAAVCRREIRRCEKCVGGIM
jgi:hypothetical protein